MNENTENKNQRKCGFCYGNTAPHKWIEPEPYSGEIGKLIITHECKTECRGHIRIMGQCDVRQAKYKYPLTQEFVDWVRTHKRTEFGTDNNYHGLDCCPDCRMAELGGKNNQASKELKQIFNNEGKTIQKDSRSEINQEEDNSNKTNWTPWIIGGGVLVILAIGLVAWLTTRNKKAEPEEEK